MPGIEPGTFCMPSRGSATELWPLSMALQGLRLRSFPSPPAWSFELEMSGIEHGTFCMPSRDSATDPESQVKVFLITSCLVLLTGDAGDWTWDLLQAKQRLYHWARVSGKGLSHLLLSGPFNWRCQGLNLGPSAGQAEALPLSQGLRSRSFSSPPAWSF